MIKIILASHCAMASGMKSSLEKIMGPMPNVLAIDAYMDDRPVDELFAQAMAQVEEEDICIVCTDLFGGSVNQRLLELVDLQKVYIFSGMNLPFLLALAMMEPKEINDDNLKRLLADARGQLLDVREVVKEGTASEDDFD